MLYTETVEPFTFSILEQLLGMPELMKFSLVGGTALSLKYGHRLSEDLDLFSSEPFENDVIVLALKKKYKNKFIIEDKPARFGIFCYIHDIKVDIIRHPHPQIRPLLNQLSKNEELIANGYNRSFHIFAFPTLLTSLFFRLPQ